MIKFEYTEYNQDLAEITQNLQTTFALARKVGRNKYTNAHPFVLCRDFLGDALVAQKTGKSKEIYGFKFDPKKQHFTDTRFVFLVKFPDAKTQENTVLNLLELIDIEKQAGIRCTEIQKVENEPLSMFVSASSIWLKSVFSVSLYTFLFKCLGYEIDKEKGFYESIKQSYGKIKRWDGTYVKAVSLESGYMQSTADVLPKIFPKFKKILYKLETLHGWENTANIHTIHEESGFVSCISKAKNNMPFNEIAQRIRKLCLE